MGNESDGRIELDDVTKEALRSRSIVPTEIVVRHRKYYPKKYRANGFKGVVWRGLDDYGGDVAIKFTIYEDYRERSYLEEAELARRLKGRGPFADFIDADVVEIELPRGKITKFICFIEDWVDGWTLSDYLGEESVSSHFFLNYVVGMCQALNILYALRLRHDDLRQANVMIAKAKPGDLNATELSVKVIDTGSLKSAKKANVKEKDDHRWFTEHLVDIWNSIRLRKSLPLVEHRFLKHTKPIIERMLEEDRVVALWEPSKIISQFEAAHTKACGQGNEDPKLYDPFDYITSEHISSDKLLIDLFAESCPWFKDVSSPNPTLLTGPRGCGKSMVFRRLSLKASLHKDPDDVLGSQIAGFYLSCSADMRNRLGWLNTENLAHRFRKEIIHYFNLLLTREITQTLSLIGKRPDRQSLFGFGKGEEDQLHAFLIDQLEITETRSLRLHGMTPMQHALEIVEWKLDSCYKSMLRATNVSESTDSSYLTELTRFLAKSISYFSYCPKMPLDFSSE